MSKKERVVEVSASDLKNSWHEYLEQVATGHQEVVVTRYGRPIAKLSPIEAVQENRSPFGSLAGSVTVQGDLVAPVGEAWDVDG